MMNFLKFTIWPWVKTRLIYWWWIVKYEGKKNIPPEVIFNKLEETAESLADDIQDAVRVSPIEEMTEGERLRMREVSMKVSDFVREIKNLRHDKTKGA